MTSIPAGKVHVRLEGHYGELYAEGTLDKELVGKHDALWREGRLFLWRYTTGKVYTYSESPIAYTIIEW